MSQTTLPRMKVLVEQLSTVDQLELVEHVMQKLKTTLPARKPRYLYGIWKGRFPDDFDLDAVLKEVRSEWEKEWDENGEFVG